MKIIFCLCVRGAYANIKYTILLEFLKALYTCYISRKISTQKMIKFLNFFENFIILFLSLKILGHPDMRMIWVNCRFPYHMIG